MWGGGSRRQTDGRRGERGQILIVAALLMTVLLGFTAMTIDVGLLFRERRNLQNAADAAALAGVLELPQSPTNAVVRANEWAVANGIDGADGRDVQNVTVTGNDTIEVQVVREDTPFLFGRVLGFMGVDIHARAVAEVGSVTGTTGLVPFGVLDTAVNYCTFAQVSQANPPAACKSTLKYDVQDVGANIGDLDFDGLGGGANEINEKIKGGNIQPLCSVNEPAKSGCATQVPMKPGNSTGQIRNAMNWRVDQTTAACDTVAEVLRADTDGDGRAEVRGECNPWGESAGPDADGDFGVCDEIHWGSAVHGSCRLIAIPVIKGPMPPAGSNATIRSFALFWLLPLQGGQCSGNSCNIEGYFIDGEVSISGLLRDLDPNATPFYGYRLVE